MTPMLRSRLLRLLVLAAAAWISVHLWSVNVEIPAQNRKLYAQARAGDRAIAAMKSMLSLLKQHGAQNPDCRRILERHQVDRLIELPIRMEDSTPLTPDAKEPN